MAAEAEIGSAEMAMDSKYALEAYASSLVQELEKRMANAMANDVVFDKLRASLLHRARAVRAIRHVAKAGGSKEKL